MINLHNYTFTTCFDRKINLTGKNQNTNDNNLILLCSATNQQYPSEFVHQSILVLDLYLF